MVRNNTLFHFSSNLRLLGRDFRNYLFLRDSFTWKDEYISDLLSERCKGKVDEKKRSLFSSLDLAEFALEHITA